MIDAGIVANAIAKNQDRSADATMRLARAYTAGEQNRISSPDQAKRVAQDFEALFISQMLDQMFGDSLGADFFGSEDTSEIYRSLVVEEYGKQITKTGGIGIADYVQRELLKMQEI